MYIPVHGQRVEHLPMVGVEPGDAEDRQSFGQAGPAWIGAQRRGHRLNQFGRMRTAEFGREPAPQLGLPSPVRRERSVGAVDVAALGPGGDHGGPAHGVRGEEIGQVPGGRPAPPTAYRIGAVVSPLVAEVAPQQGSPGLAPAAVDHPQQRPDRPLRLPRVQLGFPAQRLADGPADQPPRRAEVHAGTDAVVPTRRCAEPAGQPLGQPTLDSGSGNADDLGGEGVGQRRTQQLAQRLDQTVGALGPVDLQRHGASTLG